jgi:hypothetical protein
MMSAIYRGSRKHILDWTSLEAEVFLSSLNDLLRPTGAAVAPSDVWMPRGYDAPEEARLGKAEAGFVNKTTRRMIADWWLVHKRGANVPNWDLAATCIVEGRRGLVLVEAKAHENELNPDGKPLASNASDNSRENHERIGQAIEEACQALDRIVPGVRISRDNHYQLSNRLAWAWKLASLGIPTVLVYLGFIGDRGIADVGPCFESQGHWQQVAREHMKPVLPLDLLERPLDCGLATMQVILRSRVVIEPSPQRGVSHAL